MHYQLFGSKRIRVRRKDNGEMTSVLRPPVNEIFSAYINNYIPYHFQISGILCLTLEDGTDMLSRTSQKGEDLTLVVSTVQCYTPI